VRDSEREEREREREKEIERQRRKHSMVEMQTGRHKWIYRDSEKKVKA